MEGSGARLITNVRRYRLLKLDMKSETKYSPDKALKRFTASFMSNAKWRAFFKTVAAANLNLKRSEWKIVGDDHVEIHSMPLERDLNDTRFNCGAFQPFEYKYIEWIFIPRKYKPYPKVGLVVEQDIDGLVVALQRSGRKFPFEVEERGFTIYGYK